MIEDAPLESKSVKSRSRSKAGGGEEAKSNSNIQDPPQYQNNDNTEQQIPEEKRCYYHQLPLVFYCESCEEPICEQCTVLGPHNNQVREK